jgi:3'-5' exoribonuclease
MSKRYFIHMIELKTLANGDYIEGKLAIRSKEGPGEGLRDYSNKPGRFFIIRVGNSSGDITLKYWGGKNSDAASKLFSKLGVGDIVDIRGKCTNDSYSKELVISVNEEGKYGAPVEYIKKVKLDDYKAEDYMPALSQNTIDKLFSELIGVIKSVENPHLKALLQGFFEDEEFSILFKKTPAAKRHHHNYLGGLLEHTLNVTKLSNTLCSLYPLDRDLLITGAMLHDLGKTREYSIKASTDITNEGRFIGHLSLTVQMVNKEIEKQTDFPEEVRLKVMHMILSHHGELEKGSPKEPSFPEAMALFHADYMDAFVKNTIQELEDDEEEDWIYSRSLKRFLHRTSK